MFTRPRTSCAQTEKSCTCACAKTPPRRAHSPIYHGRQQIRAAILRSLPSFSRSVCRRLSPPSPASGRTQIPQQRLAVRGGDHQLGDPMRRGSPLPSHMLVHIVPELTLTESNPVTSLEPQVSPPLQLGLAQIISEPRSKSNDLWFKVLIFFLTQKHSQTSRNGNSQHGAPLFRKPRGVCQHTDLTVTLGGQTDSKSQKGDQGQRSSTMW